MSFYSEKELENLGLGRVGKTALISRLARFYGPEKIFLGENVRIDDFCILSAKDPVNIGSNVHISAYCALYGRHGIEIKDFSGISARSTILSSTDDFSGASLVGPTVPDEFRKEISGKVTLEENVQVGAHCVVLPGVTLKKGAAVGAMSLVNKDLEPNKIYAGIPAKILKERGRTMFGLAEKYRRSSSS